MAGRVSDPLTTKVVVYVEDNEMNATLMKGIFRRSPMAFPVELVIAETGTEGLEVIMRLKPDVVLLDLHLPDISGKDVLRRLRANQATEGIPVLVVTADAAPATIAEARFLGANGVITKPVDLVDLKSRLMEYLRPLPAAAPGSS